ncbi:DUF680 domain-containing protein [Mesorhizobium sp. CU2]|uniref:DUF680 domain-containing protein n=1 Tax=unclassified Mesorhizobium TaxID=325217 RepID=UPI00112AAAE4|nr:MULTISPECIES: DUF680 domain-containing protein [unclassified Mesorhizobium]TPN78559.1 DUF680 domain-containing protein [Mesorhizobium sp. CU3]TPO15993.1 DUF680 domain-containing protein [Mesorhizobium sp. CU2]
MTKIALTLTAVLIASGTAFAGSDNYGSANANQPAVSVDKGFTASIEKPAAAVKQDAHVESGRGIWGR